MDLRSLTRALCLSLLTSALLAGVANSQTAPEAKRTTTPTVTKLPVGTVTERSAAVPAKEVGKVVAPGVLVIDPSAILNKRILLNPGDPAARIICIGFWRKGSCAGIYIDNSKPN